MTSERKSEFNYKPAFMLALLGNALLLGALVSFLTKSPVEASAKLRERQGDRGAVTQELYMKYGDSVKVICQYPDGKPGATIIVNRTNPTLYCTNVKNLSTGVQKLR